MNEWLPEIEKWRSEGKPIVTATVINSEGSVPRPLGARLAVNSDEKMAGSVSGGCVESAVVMSAMDVMESGKPRMEHYGITNDMAWEVGLNCGGTIDIWVAPLPDSGPIDEARQRQKNGETVAVVTWLDESGKQVLLEQFDWKQNGVYEHENAKVFVEIFAPPKQLLIFGAGHTSQVLSRYAQDLGFDVVVIDARTALATRERFPNVEKIMTVWPDEAFRQLSISETTYIAILSHDPKFDEPAIMAALASDAAYIGTVGSRKVNAERREKLRANGVTEEQMARIHGPIGLNIGGKTPEEMAISIIAEIIAVEYGRPGGMMKSAPPRK